jgi:phenylalanyl-tRNA synthetase beta chain
LALANPIASDLSDMRPSLLPGLVAAAQANANRGYSDVALFEVGQVFKGDNPENQMVAASGVRHGFASSKGMGRHWSGLCMTDALDAKADALCRARCGRRADAGTADRPGRRQLAASGTLRHHPDRPQNVLGYFGELHPRSAGSARRRRPADRVRSDSRPHSRRQEEADPRQAVLELSAFQPVSRDFAFIVDRASRPATSCDRRRASTRS